MCSRRATSALCKTQRHTEQSDQQINHTKANLILIQALQRQKHNSGTILIVLQIQIGNKHCIETISPLFCVAFKTSVQLGPLWHKIRINLGHFTSLKATEPFIYTTHKVDLSTSCAFSTSRVLAAWVLVSLFTYELAAWFQRSVSKSKHPPPPRNQLKKGPRHLKFDWDQQHWSGIFYVHVTSLHQTLNHICTVEICSHLTSKDRCVKPTAK